MPPIWRQWRAGRKLGLVAAGLMAVTSICIGIPLAIPQFIATMAATETGGALRSTGENLAPKPGQ
jgi:hypothetical protein